MARNLPDTSENSTRPLRYSSTSGAAYEADKQTAFDAGAQGYLIKPIGIERLVEAIDRLIKG